MERLTHIDKYGWYVEDQSVPFDGRRRGEVVNCLAAYEDTGVGPEDIDVLKNREKCLAEMLVNISCGCTVTYGRLAELAQAEKDGRLVVLPCKPGQTIWVESCIRGRTTSIEAPDITWIIENTERFGQEIFLAREEAKAALKKREEADNEAD